MRAIQNSTTETLADRLRTRISRAGPISFYQWMKAALYDPIDGYYCRPRQVRQGRAGDYRTAPETSPLFAATFARYFAKLFVELGSPEQLTVCEVGAGEGEFAHGILRALEKEHPRMFAATRYVIDEISPDARSRVSARLAPFNEKAAFQSFAELREPLGIVFSNELLDAFPVHRLVCRNGNLREFCVGLNRDRFVWIECDVNPAVRDYCRRSEINLVEGQIIEVNLEAEEFISRAAAALQAGFVISVDYGAEREQLLSAARHRGTLRAFHRHQLVDDVLSRPGEQDLTTTIDWTQVREAGERAGLETIRWQRLDQFLVDEGLLEDLQVLTTGLTESEALRLRTNAREMILPTGMAASFQVLVQKKTA